MKATEQYFPVVLFIMLYKVILTFESVDEILKCDHSNESYWAVLSCGAVYYALQGDSNFGVCGWNPKEWPFKRKLLNRTFIFINNLKIILTIIFQCCKEWQTQEWQQKFVVNLLHPTTKKYLSRDDSLFFPVVRVVKSWSPSHTAQQNMAKKKYWSRAAITIQASWNNTQEHLEYFNFGKFVKKEHKEFS